MSSFIKFITDKKVLTIGIGLIIANQFITLSNTITKSVINPVINKVLKDQKETLDELDVEVFNVKFEVGKMITAFINFLLVLFFLFYLYKLEQYLEKRNN